MYQPPHFREDDLATQHALIRAHPLGLLITAADGAPLANALPFLLDEGSGAKGRLLAHLARANTQWKHIAAGAEALVVFQGANSYVTPSWYETKRQTGKVVPTWNYAIVQVRGHARIVEDHSWLRAQIAALTDTHEAGRAEPWAASDAPGKYIDAQLKGIVGLEIEIEAIEGKWKVSQNRPAADIAGVASGLVEDGQPHRNDEMAELVRRYGNAGDN